jgi:hypothetical protein
VAFGDPRASGAAFLNASTVTLSLAPVAAPSAGDLWYVTFRLSVTGLTLTLEPGWVLDVNQLPANNYNHRVLSRVCDGTEGAGSQLIATASSGTPSWVGVQRLHEGPFDASPLDLDGDAAGNFATGTNTTDGSLIGSNATSENNEVIFYQSSGSGSRSYTTTDADWDDKINASSGPIHCGYRNVTATETPAVDLIWSISRNWVTSFVSYKAASGGTGYTQSLDGTITPDGAVAQAVTNTAAGTVTPDGSILKAISQALAGTVTPDGAISSNLRVILQALAGTITPDGAIARLVGKGLAGTITPAGARARAVTQALAGTLTPAASRARLVANVLAGLLSPAGDVANETSGPAEADPTPWRVSLRPSFRHRSAASFHHSSRRRGP